MSTPNYVPLERFRKHFSAYFLDELLIVLHVENQSLHLLDELSAWLFLSLDVGQSKSSLDTELLETPISQDQANAAYKKIDELISESNSSKPYQHEYQDIIAATTSGTPMLDSLFGINLLGRSFNIYTNCQQLDEDLRTLFKGYSIPPAPHTQYHVFIQKQQSTYTLICNKQWINTIEEYAHIMPILMDHLQILAYQASDYLLAIHSAMLAYQGQGLMLPGTSGSGKSTLCVSLLSQGFENYSDEVSVITENNQLLMPLPLPSAIKTGSWPVLKNHYPHIDALPVWERSDGRCSKYINTPSMHSLPPVPVKCIVFPQYQMTSESHLTPLNTAQTLQKLTAAGYQIKDNLTREKVEKILTWVSGVSAYHLTYSDLDDAHQIVKKLMETT